MKNRPLTYHPVHLIYRLQGSLPSVLLSQIKEEYKNAYEQLISQYTKKDLQDERIHQLYQQQRHDLEEHFQQTYDDMLDRVADGPAFLKNSTIQQTIIDSWRKMQEMSWVNVYAISVMPNHVHVLISHPDEKGLTPLEPLMEKHKRYTGRQINAILGRKGERVWEKQAFDRDIRSKKFGNVFWYILNNPVKAHLCKSYEDWPGNYWHPDWV